MKRVDPVLVALRAWRIHHKMTQHRMAVLACMSRQSIAEWESGFRTATLAALRNLLDAHGLDLVIVDKQTRVPVMVGLTLVSVDTMEAPHAENRTRRVQPETGAMDGPTGAG